ncbi:MAG: hypothetical protein ACPGXW_06605, partial [Synechococcus sp.]
MACAQVVKSTNQIHGWVVGSEKIKLPEALLLITPSLPFPPLQRGALTTLQVNLGYRCNQSCGHCHVNAGPTRTEMMS